MLSVARSPLTACDALCTSGFVDEFDVMRSHNCAVWHVINILKRRYNTSITADIPTKFYSTIPTRVCCELRTGGGAEG